MKWIFSNLPGVRHLINTFNVSDSCAACVKNDRLSTVFTSVARQTWHKISKLGRQLNSILLSPNTSRWTILSWEFLSSFSEPKERTFQQEQPHPLGFSHYISSRCITREKNIQFHLFFNCPKYMRLKGFVRHQKSSGDSLRENNFKESLRGCWDNLLTAIIKYVVSNDSAGLV